MLVSRTLRVKKEDAAPPQLQGTRGGQREPGAAMPTRTVGAEVTGAVQVQERILGVGGNAGGLH